ncbi:MAG: hypothetical protein OES12_04005, partial [Anaerolineae bacterium]|nr:hypothetical protein [Anaerolineae bacterium]
MANSIDRTTIFIATLAVTLVAIGRRNTKETLTGLFCLSFIYIQSAILLQNILARNNPDDTLP